MKHLVFLICFSSMVNAVAQVTATRPNVPLEEESGHVVYTEVKEAPGTMAELYSKSQNWFKSYFPNPTEVIKETDAERAMVLGKHGINIYRELKYDNSNKSANQQKVGMVKYQIKIVAKDGRYKYKIDDIYLLTGTKEYVEMWLNDKLPAETVNQNYQYLAQVDKHVQDLLANLHAFMTDKGPDAPEEW